MKREILEYFPLMAHVYQLEDLVLGHALKAVCFRSDTFQLSQCCKEPHVSYFLIVILKLKKMGPFRGKR